MTPAIVIGSGISGLRFSLYLARTRPVTLITKKEAVESNTNYAQGGIAAALGADDSIELHVADTMATGAGLSDPEVVRIVVTEGPALVKELVAMGAAFEESRAGSLALGREGGHSRNRVVHSADATGREIERVLLSAAEAHPNIEIRPFHVVMDLIVQDGRIAGVTVIDPDGTIRHIPASLVCLSTGGLGRIFKYTTNPEIATGDGVAIGYRAGALLRDLEFIQFHPTALARPGASSFLISEAVRGEGAYLTTIDGDRFMKEYDPKMLDLAPRDVVARAIDREMKKRGHPHVLLHLEHLGAEFLKKRFPTINATCLLHGIAIDKTPIPVVPAAHYSCGGLVTDQHARTTIPGLYSIGETASHGLHGANRLASNSLLEALVFSRRGAAAAAEEPDRPPVFEERSKSTASKVQCGLTQMYSDRLRGVMSQHLGVFRKTDGLKTALLEITMIETGVRRLLRSFKPDRELVELANMAQCCLLITRAALSRKESRGLHCIEDGPPGETAASQPAADSAILAHTDFLNPNPGPLLRDE
ncbi:MAG: L-aspartate oxidase [Candidatus Hydrogenedentota bacterium]